MTHPVLPCKAGILVQQSWLVSILLLVAHCAVVDNVQCWACPHPSSACHWDDGGSKLRSFVMKDLRTQLSTESQLQASAGIFEGFCLQGDSRFCQVANKDSARAWLLVEMECGSVSLQLSKDTVLCLTWMSSLALCSSPLLEGRSIA